MPIPYVVDDRAGRRLSLVYAADIARAVVRVLGSSPAEGSPTRNLAVNLASPETWTFMEIMGAMAQELGVAPRSLRYALNATTDFPSVKRVGKALRFWWADWRVSRVNQIRVLTLSIKTNTRQGPVSISRAQAALGWESTPWSQIVAETVSYFEGPAMSDPRFHREREGVLRFAYQQCAKYGREQALLEAVQEVYGLDTSGFDFTGAVNPNDVILGEDEGEAARSEL